MSLADVVETAPYYLMTAAGLFVLIRYQARSRRATALGVAGLLGLATLLLGRDYGARVAPAWIETHLGSGVNSTAVYLGSETVLMGACILLLVAGVVVDRRHGLPDPSPEGSDPSNQS
jgi:hypothetical protein